MLLVSVRRLNMGSAADKTFLHQQRVGHCIVPTACIQPQCLAWRVQTISSRSPRRNLPIPAFYRDTRQSEIYHLISSGGLGRRSRLLCWSHRLPLVPSVPLRSAPTSRWWRCCPMGHVPRRVPGTPATPFAFRVAMDGPNRGQPVALLQFSPTEHPLWSCVLLMVVGDSART